MTDENKKVYEIMQNLKIEWSILKDDTKDKGARLGACARICKLSEEAKELNPNFEIIDMNNTKYAEFLPEKYVAKSDVNWDRPILKVERDYENTVNIVFDLEQIAFAWTKFRLPKERTDSQKFGMIVNANTEKLLKAYAITNS